MKVVHVIKRVETIDNDVKELRKLEKSITRNKSFSTPIYMTIEKQINILLGERIKLLELTIANPPESLENEIEGDGSETEEPVFQSIPEPKKVTKPKAKAKAKTKKTTAKSTAKKKTIPDFDSDDDIPMLTQDQIDAKFDSMARDTKPAPKKTTAVKAEASPEPEEITPTQEKDTAGDDSIKLLDVALENGSLNNKVMEKEKKVRFFRENFPSD